MLAKVEMDAVLIVTPHADHFEQVSDSLDAGLHVLVEKPMVITSADARKVIKRAAKKKRIVSVAFPGTFTQSINIFGLNGQGRIG